MPTLSIALTDDEHRRLAAGAAKSGISLGDYVRSRILTEDEAMTELSAVLKPRIERADGGEVSHATVADIAKAARAKFVS